MGHSTETALLHVWSDMLMAANEHHLTLLCMHDVCGIRLCQPLNPAAPSTGWRWHYWRRTPLYYVVSDRLHTTGRLQQSAVHHADSPKVW